MKNSNADFVVFVMLNRGDKLTDKASLKKSPDIFVFPMDIALAARREDDWKKVMTKKIVDRENYREKWDSIRNFLDPQETMTK